MEFEVLVVLRHPVLRAAYNNILSKSRSSFPSAVVNISVNDDEADSVGLAPKTLYGGEFVGGMVRVCRMNDKLPRFSGLNTVVAALPLLKWILQRSWYSFDLRMPWFQKV